MTTIARIITCGIALGACDDEVRVEREPPEARLRSPGVTVALLVRDPLAYDGQTVRVIGTVSDIVGRRTFELRDHGLLWAPTLPVIASTATALERALISERDEVLVIGIVHARVTPQLTRELGEALPAEVLLAIGDGPVLVARTLRRADT